MMSAKIDHLSSLTEVGTLTSLGREITSPPAMTLPCGRSGAPRRGGGLALRVLRRGGSLKSHA